MTEEQTAEMKSTLHDMISFKLKLKDVTPWPNINELRNPGQHSSGLLTIDTTTRFYLSLCLQKLPYHPTEMDYLIEFLQKKNLITERDIEILRKQYTPDQAIHFYSRYAFMYENLNGAFRTTNISQLLSFGFFYRDLCNQLREMMKEQETNESITVYRGQRTSMLEIIQLFVACDIIFLF